MPEVVERNGTCYEIEYGPGCENCDGIGAYLEHAPRCSDEFCVGNGDEHSCNGDWLPCPSCGAMRKI
jgi:hypothetical protein